MSWLRLLLVFILLQAFIVTVYRIPSASMEPTLHGDRSFIRTDRVAVNKLAFGLTAPFARQSLLQYGAPKRWDIVAFWSPQPNEEGDILIKRVVGLPGERVRVMPGNLRINGKRIQPPIDVANSLTYTTELGPTRDVVRRQLLFMAWLGRPPIDMPKDDPGRFQALLDVMDRLQPKVVDLNVASLNKIQLFELTRDVDADVMNLVNEWWSNKLHVAAPVRYGVYGSVESQLVPEGHYFCLGDNGLESIDSRMFGWVPHENLIGRVFAIVTPPGRMRDLSGFLDTSRGRVIFWSVTAFVLAFEFIPGFVAFSARLRGPIEALGLRTGDRVLVNRLVYGLRLPFSSRRLIWWRRPVLGDVVCYSLSRRGGVVDLYYGAVTAPFNPETRVCEVRGPESASLELRPVDIVGRASIVWWPLRRLRRVGDADLG